MIKSLLFAVLFCLSCFVATASEKEPAGELQSIRVRDAEFHYSVVGKGSAIVFVHGGLADYREWQPVAASLSNTYKTIVYSRRYNFPNTNEVPLSDFSALTEADDLAAEIQALKLEPVTVVGASYGAYTALVLAIRYPKLVRNLILAEPPLLGWLKEIPGGPAVYDDFMNRLWIPITAELKKDQSQEAIDTALNFFVGPEASKQLPMEVREIIRLNLKEWKMLTASTNIFPTVTREDVRKIGQPVLMLSGGNSYQIGKLLDPEIEKELKNVERKVIPNGTHDLCTEFPQACADEIGRFLAANEQRGDRNF
jgi:non-heme chloroperoxidase